MKVAFDTYAVSCDLLIIAQAFLLFFLLFFSMSWYFTFLFLFIYLFIYLLICLQRFHHTKEGSILVEIAMVVPVYHYHILYNVAMKIDSKPIVGVCITTA